MMLIISPFAGSDKVGHPNKDDIFYLEYLRVRQVRCVYCTSRFVKMSAQANQNVTIVDQAKLNPFSIFSIFKYFLGIRIWKFNKVLFFGYTEKLLFIAFIMCLISKTNISVVATNNFGNRRVKKFNLVLRSLYKLVASRLKLVVVHSEYERKVVREIISQKTEIYSKKHHLCIPVDCKQIDHRRFNIGFWGPDKLEKTCVDFIRLIELDRDSEYTYLIVNCNSMSIPESVRSKPNVTLVNKWLDDETYRAMYRSCDVIFMGHTKDFEGKLSGNLCDCISLGVPWVSLKIEPYIEFNHILGRTQNQYYDSRNLKLAIDDAFSGRSSFDTIKCKNVFSFEEVYKDLDEILSIVDVCE